MKPKKKTNWSLLSQTKKKFLKTICRQNLNLKFREIAEVIREDLAEEQWRQMKKALHNCYYYHKRKKGLVQMTVDPILQMMKGMMREEQIKSWLDTYALLKITFPEELISSRKKQIMQVIYDSKRTRKMKLK